MENMNTGQIKLHQKLGKWIETYAKDENYHRYLEIGSWNGRGSTVCFASGFENRKLDFEFNSFEINPERLAESKNVWYTRPHIQIRYGRILPELPDVRSIHKNVVEEWQSDDEKHFKNAPFFDVSVYKPEVVLLDGGEYLTYFEYKLLKQYTKVFLLDDTDVAKCKQIVEELSADENWKCVDIGHDRNGWAVFQTVQ